VDEEKIKSYFEEQVRVILKRSAAEPDGFRAYFAGREPREEEILGLIAISSMMGGKYHQVEPFPTPVEALAALSSSTRQEIVRVFRRELKTCLRQLTAA
jgi:hypothetical protein